MAYYNNVFTNEKRAKRNYNNLTDSLNDGKFKDTLNELSKLTIYFLMYSGVPEHIIPLVLANTSQYTVQKIRAEVNKALKKNCKCVICGGSENLTLHHIKPIKDYPELKFRYDNLKPICLNCHKNLHNWEE